MKKFILLLSLIALFCQSANAQTGGLNFQGVARNATGAVLANQKINLKFSILRTTETGTVEYTETKEVTTNAQGIFAVVVGEVNASSFAAVDWKSSPKFLKVEMDPAGGTSFVSMGTTRLQNVPYAYYANGVNANNIDGVVPVSKGGTGATDAAAARTNLGLVIGTNVQAPLTAGTDYLTPSGNAATATKLAAPKKINGVDFDGSADISITATADASTLSGTVAVAKGGTGATTAADARANLGLAIGTNVQAPLTAGTDYLTPSGNAASATKLSTARNINGVAFDGSADISITATADASTLSGTVAIAKGGTGATDAATARTNLGLVIGTNVQAPLTAGTDYLTPTGSAAGLTSFPTLNQSTSGNAATATKLVSARNINGVSFDGSTDITVVADASTLSGTVAIAKGGTGATTAAAARTNLGLVIGSDVQSPLTAGTDYLTPTGSAAGLTSFPTLNQSTTGNAATATLAGNITATSNASLTTLSNLNTVGTITSGVWSGTLIPIAKGGTGSSTQNFVDLTSAQTVAGEKTFSSNLTVNGNIAGTGTSTFAGTLLVGGTTPTGTSAALEIKSTTKGLLLPRLTTAQRNAISAPTAGLVIFNTSLNKFQGAVEANINSLSQLSTNNRYNVYNDLPIGQTFTVPTQSTLKSIDVGIINRNNATVNIELRVYQGVLPLSGNALPAPIATAYFTTSTSTDPVFQSFDFGSTLSLTPGSYYFALFGVMDIQFNTAPFVDVDATSNQVSEKLFQYNPSSNSIIVVDSQSVKFKVDLLINNWVDFN